MNNKTIINHYVSRSLAENFRKENESMWILDCKNGSISNKNTSKSNLFMKRNAWNQEVENAFGIIENEVMPLIKKILLIPRNTFSSRVFYDRLDAKYNNIQKYIFQSLVFQSANSPNKMLPEREKTLCGIASSNFNTIGNTYIIIYNHLAYADCPLLLPDNVMSYATMPSQDKKQYYGFFFLPISPYHLLLFGNDEQVKYFSYRHIYPHAVNKYKVLIESKSCKVASSNKKYLSWFSKEYKHFDFQNKNASIKSERGNT